MAGMGGLQSTAAHPLPLVDLGVARSLRRSRSSRHCAHISSLAAAVDVDDAAETLATGDGAMRSRHAVAAGELAGHIQAASRATRRRQALIQRHERSVLSSQHVYGGRRCALIHTAGLAILPAPPPLDTLGSPP